jgi:putative transposase
MFPIEEQCLYLHQFASLEEARCVIGAFIHRYNTEWLIARLGYRTPAAARAAAWAEAA